MHEDLEIEYEYRIDQNARWRHFKNMGCVKGEPGVPYPPPASRILTTSTNRGVCSTFST